MTTGVFNHIDPASFSAGAKPWAKVDINAASYTSTTDNRPVHDIRSLPASTFGTDVSGFEVHHAPNKSTTTATFDSDPDIRTIYYPEVEALLRARLPAGSQVDKVVFFDHTIRQHDPSAARQPVQQVHVDQTPAAAAARVRRHLPAEEVDERLKGRYQIVNIWRPIGHVASDFPLAVVDWRTMGPKDLVDVELLYPKRDRSGDDDDRGKEVWTDPKTAGSTEGYEIMGETYGVAANDEHKFYYAKDMTPEEAMFIKCFDSRSQGQPEGRKGVAACTPHSGFIDPQTPADAPGRKSIEVRALVFYGAGA